MKFINGQWRTNDPSEGVPCEELSGSASFSSTTLQGSTTVNLGNWDSSDATQWGTTY